MITVFHGDDQVKSRKAFLDAIGKFSSSEILNLDSKSIDIDKVNNFLNAGSLFPGAKLLTVSNYFSISKPTIQKLNPLITKSGIEVLLWQDKAINAAQAKTFPKATVLNFKADNTLYACLNALKPHNAKSFMNLLDKVIVTDLYDLFFYLLKGSLRRQLSGRSYFDQPKLLKTYLQLIELEYQTKSGQLSTPREMALKRVLLSLLK